MSSLAEPRDDPLDVSMDQCPHGFMAMSEMDTAWFMDTVNSDVRRYYRLIRHGTVHESSPIGRSGITVGELAIFILRSNHVKRKRRY